MEKFLSIVGKLILVVGVITSIIMGWWTMMESRNMFGVVTIFVGILVSVIGSLPYLALSHILKGIEEVKSFIRMTTNVTAVCPSCGAKVSFGAKSCHSCGEKFDWT